MRTFRLEKIVRQKDEGLRLAVEAIAEGRIADGVGLLTNQGRVQEMSYRQKRFQAIAEAFAESPDNTLVISPDNQSRHELNATIRTELKHAGHVGADVFELGVLRKRQDLTSEDRKAAASYQVGDAVRYLRGSDTIGLAAKTYASVVEVDAEENLLTVRRQDGCDDLDFCPDEVIQNFDGGPLLKRRSVDDALGRPAFEF